MNKILHGDSVEVLKTLEADSIDCVITSPPYNKGAYKQRDFGKRKGDTWNAPNITYGDFNDCLEPDLYAQQQRAILTELVRVLKPKGSIFYNHKALIYKHRLIYPTWVFDFNVRQQIIWDRGSTPAIEPIRWFPTTEYIFWITKEASQPKFNGSLRRFKSEIWRINPKPMKDHPAPFPEEVVAECMTPTTDSGDIVLDPYMGSGTTALVAQKLGRRYLGIELNPEYIKIAEARIAAVAPSLL